MAYGLGGALLNLLGGPDPTQQLYRELGQGPGQPGSPQGANPLAAGAVPGGQGGAAAGPPFPAGGPPATPGSPPGGPPPAGGPPASPGVMQQVPQALQSPPDLAQLYMQMTQRDQQAAGINRGLGALFSAMAKPANKQAMLGAFGGGEENTGAMFNNFLQLQQYAQQQQNRQQMIQNLPTMLEKAGLDQSYLPLVLANPDLLEKIVETKAGVGGDSVRQELNATRADWLAQNPGKTQADMVAARPELADVLSFAGAKQQQGAEMAAAGKEKIATQTEFPDMDRQYQALESNIAWLNDPAHRDAVVKAIQKPELFTEGQGGRWLGGTAIGQAITGVDQDTLTAKAKLDQLHNQLYSTSFSGKNQRLAAVEASRLGNAYTNLNSPTLSSDAIGTELQRLQDQAMTSHANIYASAGQVVPAQYRGLADPQYLPGSKSPLYNGAKDEPVPDFSNMSDADADAAYARLPAGQAYVGPDGKVRRK